MISMTPRFAGFAQWASTAAGSPFAFSTATGLVVLWGLSGPMFGFSNTWQLLINTGTTILTFLMVFLIQSSQNRDTQALQLKLDELIRAVHGARNHMIEAEKMDDEEIAELKKEYARLAAETRDTLDSTRDHLAAIEHRSRQEPAA